MTMLRNPDVVDEPTLDAGLTSDNLVVGDSGTANPDRTGSIVPRWQRPALFGLLGITAILYLWGLGSQGWANSFYAAAVQAGSKSWKAMFFGSFDTSNFITVDKPPASLWVMDLSARIFGLNSWSLLVPQALEGVATVGILYATVKRWSSSAAGLVAGAVVALTPVAALMFRYDNPDALLVLLLTGAAYATTRAVESGRTRWLVLATTLVGTGFLTKMMQAFLIVPAIGIVYLVAGPPKLGRRIGQLLMAGLALIASSAWWVVIVELVPARDRPYIGGSQNNSILNLIFGYNGFGRVTGSESGSTANQWGPTGWDRLFLSSFGSQISWLIPGALVLMVGTFWITRRTSRRNYERAGMIFWGGWLLVTGLLLSYAKGIIHPYYTVALAPAIGAIVGIGAAALWPHRTTWFGRSILASATAGTTWWSYTLLSRSSSWMPELRVLVLVVGLITAVGIMLAPISRRYVGPMLAGMALVVALAGPAAYTLDTVAVAHSGAIPSAGPTQSGSTGGPAGVGGAGGPGGRPAGSQAPTGFGGGGAPNGFGRAPAGAGRASAGGQALGGRIGMGQSSSAGGLLSTSTPSAALTKLLKADAANYGWVAAVVGSDSASGYQLATGDPVMAIGGFNGTDPAPTLAQFETDVAQGKIHYFIAGGGTGGGGPSSNTTKTTGSEITSWVEKHFTATTVGGVTLYDLSSAASK